MVTYNSQHLGEMLMETTNQDQQWGENKIKFPMYAPPSEIESIVKLIRELIYVVRNFLKIEYPSSHTRMRLMIDDILQLVGYQIEQIEGVICLAETNLFHYPSAFVISRTVIEINVVLEWLLNPEEESERILRYIRYLNSQLSNYNEIYVGCISNSTIPSPDKNKLLEKKNKIDKDIHEMTQAAIDYGIPPEGISDLKKLPNFTNEMLKVISPNERQNSFKLAYYVFSKFTHGMRQSIYRYHDPNFSSYVPVSDWKYPLYICYEPIIVITQKILERFNDKPEQFDFNLRLIKLMSRIKVQLEKKMDKVFSLSGSD